MGDSKSWGYDRASETKICKYGQTSKYFDKCSCFGCSTDNLKKNLIEKILVENKKKLSDKSIGELEGILTESLYESEILSKEDWF